LSEAIAAVEGVAQQLDNALALGGEQRNKLLDLRRRLAADRDYADYMFQPGRTFIKVGQLQKHSPRGHIDTAARTLVLVSVYA
jgi:hypothetical protein